MRAMVAAVAMMWGAVAAAQAPGFDPRAHRDFAGPPTQVLVLGTPHLSGLPPAFTLDSLGPLLDRLAAFRPDIITTEDLSGAQCEELVRYKPRYPEVADSYCWDPAIAAKATRLDLPAATAAVAKRLAAWPKSPTPADRRGLAALFLAANDRGSAVVQWLRLAPAERHAGDGLDTVLADYLAAQPARRNESYAIAAALAARLGLERVHPTDDHTADAPVAGLGEDYGKAMNDVWRAAAGRMAEMDAMEARLGTPQATLEMYRAFNQPRNAQQVFDSDFGAALKHRTPELYGRQYVGWWEVRNLRMAANIRETFVNRPGARVLSIVGASHKGYFEAYLGMMHDVTLVDAATGLK